jgi:apolipoprotein D and lipocalin family protein
MTSCPSPLDQAAQPVSPRAVRRRQTPAPLTMACGLIVLALGLSGCISNGGQPPVPLAKVDMSRMYGGWYLIATRKNGFEKGLVGPYDVYSKRPDGDIREDFYVRKNSFKAPLKHFTIHDWVKPDTNNARWRVQVLWPINLPFLVLYTDPDYRYVLFGEDNRKLGWIYSRKPKVPEADYQDLLARFKALGYDTSTFVRFVQTPDQIGKPGVWSDGIQ